MGQPGGGDQGRDPPPPSRPGRPRARCRPRLLRQLVLRQGPGGNPDELENGLNPGNFQEGERSVYLGDESAARTLSSQATNNTKMNIPGSTRSKVLKNNSQIVISGSRRVEKLVMSTRFHKIELRNSTE